MQFVVNDQQKLLGDAGLARARSRVNAAFAKFGDNIKSVEITVHDINGPRGGIDKQCRVFVGMKKNKDIMVTTTEESLSRAIPIAVDRAARAVRRVLDRRMLRKSLRTSGLQLESWGGKHDSSIGDV